LYASRATAPLTPETIDAIVEQSQRNNPPRGITGLLCVFDDIFIQVLEGGRDAVCELLNGIIRDPRHHTVRLLSYEEITERHFAQWSMGQVRLSSVNAALLLKYSEKPRLDPFGTPAGTTMALLSELVQTGAISSRTA
jgi:hypothetical protein